MGAIEGIPVGAVVGLEDRNKGGDDDELDVALDVRMISSSRLCLLGE